MTKQVSSETFRNRSVKQIFPVQNSVLPWDVVRPGHCAFSGKPIDHHYMHNTGITRRWLCEQEYQKVIQYKSNVCRMCGEPFDEYQYMEQYRQPREIINYFCVDCAVYLSFCAMKVVGDDVSFLLEEQGYSRPMINVTPQPRALPNPQHALPDPYADKRAFIRQELDNLRHFNEIANEGRAIAEETNRIIDEAERVHPHFRGQIQRVALPGGRPHQPQIGYNPQPTVDEYFGTGLQDQDVEIVYLPRKKGR
jgi:hypothetical protein